MLDALIINQDIKAMAPDNVELRAESVERQGYSVLAIKWIVTKFCSRIHMSYDLIDNSWQLQKCIFDPHIVNQKAMVLCFADYKKILPSTEYMPTKFKQIWQFVIGFSMNTSHVSMYQYLLQHYGCAHAQNSKAISLCSWHLPYSGNSGLDNHDSCHAVFTDPHHQRNRHIHPKWFQILNQNSVDFLLEHIHLDSGI